MANSKVGCSSGKTILVDPNKFDGQNSFNNMSVPLEDLNISVELTTSKKARTVLITKPDGDGIVNQGSNTDDVTIRFIDGSNVNGKKVLTTSYTDLTTSFEKGNQSENLGITNIDIDFSSAYAPQITISFIDVRGSAIFQNENNAANDINKYSVFFQLPYPIYQLTIKGYYGKPVKYCLHMTKFNSRFNSQTGNFEIIATYIGYTYAMLTDMLIGYLKAIPYTALGKKRFEELRKQQPDGQLLTLSELMRKISDINSLATKIKTTDPNSLQLISGEQQISLLNSIEANLNILGSNLDIKDDLGTYRFIIMKSTKSESQPTTAPSVPSGYAPSNLTLDNANPNTTSIIKRYNDDISANLKLYNENTTFKLAENDFTNLTFYQGLTLSKLNPDNGDQLVRNDLVTKLGNTDFENRRAKIFDYVKSHGDIGDDQLIDIYDLSKQFDLVIEKRNQIGVQTKKLTKELGQTMKNEVSRALGFEPTIRNIIKIFCAHVEVFLGVIYDVAVATKDNKDRTKQLKKFVNNEEAFDIKQNAIGSSGDAVGGLEDQYYPWPEYRKADETSGLIETYLGELGVLSKPQDVDELAFIDDLLKAFLTSAKLDEEIGNQIGEEETSWYPVNPLDTRLFISKFPYKRIAGTSRSEVINDMVIRAMIYMGYSNKKLTPEEIQTMANIEADAVLKDVNEDKIIQTLTQINSSDFKNAKGFINAKDTLVIKPLGDFYYYDYIFDSDVPNPDVLKVLPLVEGFTGNWDPNTLEQRGKEIFLTNYSSNNISGKVNDGGIYIKIISIDEYKNKSKTLVEGPQVTDGVLNLEKLKLTDVPLDVGYNPFGGAYGIQEFSQLDYGEGDTLAGLPLSYVFYRDANFGQYTFNKSNGLGAIRASSGPTDGQNTTTSAYDITSSTYIVPESIDVMMELIDGSDSEKVLHKNYGKNRALAKQYLSGAKDVTYPFVNFQVAYGNDSNFGLAPVSLFGSRLYYEQENSRFPKYAKALLFLHTLPWNGLMTTNEGGFDFHTGKTIFDAPEIRNLFSNRAGFITVPKLWAAFIGAMLWRADLAQPIFGQTNEIIGGGSGTSDPILFRSATEEFIPTFTNTSPIPAKNEYLTKWQFGEFTDSINFPDSPMVFDGGANNLFGIVPLGHNYKLLDDTLLNLPDQAKDEFKKVFFEFVTKNDVNSDVSDWDMISGQLEIWNGTAVDWVSAFTSTVSSIVEGASGSFLNTTTIRGVYNANYNGSPNWDNYIIVAPIINDDDFANNFILELKGGTNDNQAVKTLLDKFTDEIIIMNTGYKIWESNTSDDVNTHEEVSVLKSDLDIYINAIVDKFTKNKDAITPDAKKKETEQNLFGTSDENLIKFNFYKTLKAIYDKWVGGAQDGNNIIFQCGSRNSIDFELAKKARGEGAVPSLIDSFRFVSRSFKDIGDDFIINPLPINDFLLTNPNSSFYDAIGSLLSANNFDFIALPSYINYNDDSELASMFEPLPYNEAMKDGVSGPSFVCVYVGQASKNLDFGNSNYPNDGFDVQCDSNNNMLPGVPKDFTNNADDSENNVAVFAVNYGQQNQNIFKDITLDQSEFTETAESLQITEDISKKGAENNRSFVGQNIFNVYQVRSYKTEVEMMGNAMIQPMMYFQLNNIPMFHGAYMITRVKHNIKPNYMSTHFTGVRIRKPETPLIDVGVLYMNMLEAMTTDDIGSGTGGDGAKRVFGGDVIGDQKQYVGYVSYEVKENDGLKYQEHNPNGGGDNYAMKESGQFIEKLAIEWNKQAKNEAYTDTLYVNNFGAYGGGTNKKHGEKSKHGIGLAVDFRPMASNKAIQSITVSSKNYDHAANVKLVTLIFELIAKENGNLELDNIILNDSALITIFDGRKNRNGGNIVISAAGHENHMHIEFYVPKRIEDRVKQGYFSEEDILTSPVTGSASKFTGNLPTATEKEKSLGQI